ncbi:MAG: hypothetical protein Q8T09_19120 [Candidatus Melainabacteria bacterium]|nr:hypothetical protein [Candidatus Melainabacteria bacterium]
MINATEPWLLTQEDDDSIPALARSIYKLVCRKDYTQPGFALVRQTGVKLSGSTSIDLISKIAPSHTETVLQKNRC